MLDVHLIFHVCFLLGIDHASGIANVCLLARIVMSKLLDCAFETKFEQACILTVFIEACACRDNVSECETILTVSWNACIMIIDVQASL